MAWDKNWFMDRLRKVSRNQKNLLAEDQMVGRKKVMSVSRQASEKLDPQPRKRDSWIQ